MGMAASQARYLALVARKSNCEYEGQQINQARTVLSNQSASLFNQMLGLKVPVPPSTSDFSKMQYSYSDGVNEYVIEDWQQLANPEEDYNYIVTRSTYQNEYTGSQKKLNDPQVQFQTGADATVEQIELAVKLVTETQKQYEEAKAATKTKEKEAATLSNYADNESFTGVSECNYDAENNVYSVTQTQTIYTDAAGNQYYIKDGKYYKVDDNTEYTGDVADLSQGTITKGPTDFVGYEKLADADKEKAKTAIDALVKQGAMPEDIQTDYAGIYVDADGNIALKSDLRNLYGGAAGGTKTVLPVYPEEYIGTTVEKYNSEISMLQSVEFQALQAYDNAKAAYESLCRPTYVGNCALTLLTELTEDQKAELRQVVKDMKAQDTPTSIEDCFNENDEYLGGIYTFKMNNTVYYTTFEDLNKSYASGSGINNIDGQVQLSYYNASYIKQKKEDTVKALLETDGNGRFTSVRFEDDSVTYTLNVETTIDDAAYKDAMNQYNYENAMYDKMVQDINVKTSLIQQEDQQLELRLKQLDTEQNALSTEIDAVSKVVKDNVEKSFKTFGG